MKFSLLCCVILSLTCLAPAYSFDFPTPQEKRKEVETSKAQDLYHAIEDIKYLLWDCISEENGILKGTVKFPTKHFTASAVVSAISQARNMGWKVSSSVEGIMTVISISE